MNSCPPAKLPNRIKQQLFDAFDLAMLYSKTKNQITCRATITPTTPHTLAAVITASETPNLTVLLADHQSFSDLTRQPGATPDP